MRYLVPYLLRAKKTGKKNHIQSVCNITMKSVISSTDKLKLLQNKKVTAQQSRRMSNEKYFKK
jgi:hypothetical protein